MVREITSQDVEAWIATVEESACVHRRLFNYYWGDWRNYEKHWDVDVAVRQLRINELVGASGRLSRAGKKMLMDFTVELREFIEELYSQPTRVAWAEVRGIISVHVENYTTYYEARYALGKMLREDAGAYPADMVCAVQVGECGFDGTLGALLLDRFALYGIETCWRPHKLGERRRIGLEGWSRGTVYVGDLPRDRTGVAKLQERIQQFCAEN